MYGITRSLRLGSSVAPIRQAAVSLADLSCSISADDRQRTTPLLNKRFNSGKVSGPVVG
jgi:hypothetical protein